MKHAFAAVVLAGFAAIGAGAAEEGGGPPPPAPAPVPAPAVEEPMKPPEPPPPPVDPVDLARREEKARKLLAASGWLDQTKTSMLSLVDGQEEKGVVPKGTAEQFRKVADWDGLLKAAVASYARNVDEKAMDAAIVFYETPEGKRFSEQQSSMVKAGAIATRDFTVDTTAKAAAAAGKANVGEKAKGLLDRIKGKKPEENEKATVVNLNHIVRGEAQMQTSGKIDADGDGFGEYGTLMELGAMTPLRRGSADFSRQHAKHDMAVIPTVMGKVDGDGIVEVDGYLFRVYLPAPGGEKAGFVHESGTPKDPAIAGDAAAVGVDLAERFCFVYAWPAERGKTGTRAFFVYFGMEPGGEVDLPGTGEVLVSANEKAQWSGKAKAPPGYAALLGDTATSAPAIGTLGRDGDVWKAAE